MKPPKYPQTPAINCLYCRHYNSKTNTCTAPYNEKIANFFPKKDADCLLFKIDITESPKENKQDFVDKYCKGTNCPFYYASANLCTRPSKCPYTDTQKNRFETISYDNEIEE